MSSCQQFSEDQFADHIPTRAGQFVLSGTVTVAEIYAAIIGACMPYWFQFIANCDMAIH